MVLLLGGQVIDSKMGAGWMGEESFAPPLFYPGFQLVYPQSNLFSLSFTACDRVIYRPKKFKGGGMVQHRPTAKNQQAEGLGPE